MKRCFKFAILVMFACVLVVFAGCGRAEDSSGGTTSVKSTTQNVPNGVRVSAIDVGKGDCILVQAGGMSALIDTGYDSTSGEVVFYLRNQGVERLDCLVITHYDKDHVGGLRAIGKAFDIDAVYLPGYEGADKNYRTAMAAVNELGFPVQRVVQKQVLTLGDASFTIYPSSVAYVPDAKGNEGNDDDLSLVTTLVFGGDSYLFAGDLEKDGIAAFLKSGFERFDVLKMPDHGQKCSNTDEFLAEVQPRIAVITDSAADPADKKSLKLLAGCGAETYRTSECGTVVVESAGTGNYSVVTSR